jgi:hypothetical protein
MGDDVITVVSGLPRSGTSMMMRMLEAGGMSVLTDNLRAADEDNPRGYYEFERVKSIKDDRSWLVEARGKVVKMVSALLVHLPRDHRYRVVFMRRRMDEILASQQEMLRRRDRPVDAAADGRMAALYERHLKQTEEWIAGEPNVDVIYVDYNRLMADPATHVERVNEFLGSDLDVAAMVQVADRSLYRQRR